MTAAQAGLSGRDAANLEVAWVFAMPKTSGIRGQGVVKDGKTGDLLVEIAVAVPEKLSGESERLMKEFAAAAKLEY